MCSSSSASTRASLRPSSRRRSRRALQPDRHSASSQTCGRPSRSCSDHLQVLVDLSRLHRRRRRMHLRAPVAGRLWWRVRLQRSRLLRTRMPGCWAQVVGRARRLLRRLLLRLRDRVPRLLLRLCMSHPLFRLIQRTFLMIGKTKLRANIDRI